MISGTTYSEDESDYQDTIYKYNRLCENFVYYHFPKYEMICDLDDDGIKKALIELETMRKSPTIRAYIDIFKDVMIKRRVNKIDKLINKVDKLINKIDILPLGLICVLLA